MLWLTIALFWILILLVTASAIYHLICIYSAAKFFSSQKKLENTTFTPPITILKPVRGIDERAYDCWVSCCKQDYPSYEIIFGVRDKTDPAISLIKQLQREFPQLQIKLVISDQTIGINAKVSNLNNMLECAENEILVLSDSDIFVPSDYLKTVVAPLQNEKIGVVTCLYRAIGSTNFAALMEGLGISGEFILGVLTARQLEGIKFALGSTIAIKKQVLAKFGGFTAIADYLADDFLIGNLAAKSGYQVYLSECIVDTVLPDYKLSDFLKHQIRWARGVKFSRPGGYIGLVFTFTTFFSLVLLLGFTSNYLAWTVALTALTIRFLAAWLVGGVWLGDRRIKRYFYLLPIRDLFSFLVWAASFVGRTVYWRGDKFYLTSGGRLVLSDKK
ncbi:MAG: bacteriohopanetetrol glucosamine biosynthesis glycosyltransferase HpnI [Blastocatellia bacterium]